MRQLLAIALFATITSLASSAAAPAALADQKKIVLSEMDFSDAIIVSHRTQGCFGGSETLLVFQKNPAWQVTILPPMARSGVKVMPLTKDEIGALDKVLDHHRAPKDYFVYSTNEERISLVQYRFGKSVMSEEFHDRSELSRQHPVNFSTIIDKALFEEPAPSPTPDYLWPFRVFAIFLFGATIGGFIIWRSRPILPSP